MFASTKNASIRLHRFAPVALLLLLLLMGKASAGDIYRCGNGRSTIAFQATPCDIHVEQTVVDVRTQPLIDAGAPSQVLPSERHQWQSAHAARHVRAQARADARTSMRAGSRHAHAALATSWECRASDGEVFYRHSRCPHSVPGDGIARFGADQARTASPHGRRNSRGGAWGPVSVTARKIPRVEACRQINAVTADARDGHARDEQVSVYDHNVGRDPCSGF